MENNNISSNKKFSIGRLIIMSLILMIVVIGGTFAWFTFSSNKSALVLTIGDINDTQIKLKPYEINATMVPSNTYSDGVYSDVEISKGNNDSTSFTLFYKINKLDTKLIDNGLSYTIVNTENDEIVKDGKFSELIDTSEDIPEEVIILNTDTDTSLVNNETAYYRTYLWLDSSVGNQTDIQNSTIELELNGSIGSVAISGDNIYGGTLTATIADAVSDPTITYNYQWYYNTSATTSGGTLIEGATESSYIIGDGMPGKYIYLVVTTSTGKTLSTVMDEVVAKANCSCTISSYSTQLNHPTNTTDTIGYTCSGDGEVYVTSSVTDVISVGDVTDTSATLTANNLGSSVITVGRNESVNYNACSTTQSISVANSEFTITYYLGNGTSTAGSTKLGTSTCIYGETCTLTTFDDLGGTFPYSDGSSSSETWAFYGWGTSSTDTSRDYENGEEFTYSSTGNLNLYAIGRKKYFFYMGKDPTSYSTSIAQYWNPHSTSSSYLSSITLPTADSISSWSFYGYARGSDSASSSVSWNSSSEGTDVIPAYDDYPYVRTVYSRTLTVKYDGNGSTSGSTADTTKTQYYNSGTGSGGSVSSPSFTLAANGFTKTGNTFSNWCETAAGGGTCTAASGTYSAWVPAVDDTTVTKTLYANWNANTYTITYYLGNGTSTAGSTKLGTSTCNYGETCTLKTFANLGGIFPNSEEDKTANGKTDYDWHFYGWGTTNSDVSRNYSDGEEFTYSSTGNLNLYAIGYKKFYFYSDDSSTGAPSSKMISNQTQYWNPHSTAAAYLSKISIPTATELDGWTFIGYKGGVTKADSSIDYEPSTVGTEVTPAYTKYGFVRSKYKRTVTIKYGGNGSTSGSTSNTTATQYYNCGLSADASAISTPSFTLAANGFAKTGYTFSKWCETTAGGGTCTSASGTYSAWTPAVDTTTVSKTLYAKWTANTYTIKYYLGNGTSTAGSTAFSATTTCTYDKDCTLKTFSDLGGTFPYSSDTDNDYYWDFYGWGTSTSDTARNYTDGGTVKNLTSTAGGTVKLYAIGYKRFYYYSYSADDITKGVNIGSSYQYWNPHSTAASYLTTITLPSANSISGWTFIGYKAASNTANSTVDFAASTAGTAVTPAYSLGAYIRTKYKRTVTIKYGGNGSTGGSTANTTTTQYYNSGTTSASTSKISTPSFTLAANGFTRTNATFDKWCETTAGGGTCTAAGGTYSAWVPAVNSTTVSKTLYAKWIITPTLTQSASSGTVYVGSTKTYTIKSNVAGKFTVKSSATAKATVAIDSTAATAANTNRTVTITGVAAGSSTITVTFTPTDTTNYKSTTKTYAATVSVETINAYRYSCEAANRMSKLWVTTCKGSSCTYTARNDMTSSFSFSDDAVTTSPSWSVSKSSIVSSLSSLSTSCPKKTMYTSGVSSNLNCRNGPTTSNQIIVAFVNSTKLTAYQSTMKYGSSNWWYIPDYQCFIIGSYLSTTDPSTASGGLTSESKGCYDTCNALGKFPRQYNQNCYCCPSNKYIATGSITSSCAYQYGGLS